MRIRGYEKDDQAALGRVISLAFGGTDAGGERYLDPGHNRRLDPDLVYVAEEDGAPRATAVELPMQVYLDGRAVPMGGVSGVATHPAYRRRRLAKSLLEAVLYGMRERGVHISMLAPFSHAFYRASGYELAGEAIAYDLSPADLPTSPEQSHVRAHREADLPAMKHMLETEAASHRLCVRRGESRWHEILENPAPVDEDDEAKESAVYERDGVVEGYLLYRHRKGTDSGERTRILEVPELVAGTQRAREARVRYQTSPNEPLHPFLQSSYVRATIEPEKMLRLVDVEGALSYLSRSVPEPLVLEVTDDAIPENAGTYTVGEGNVVRGAAAPERVALDVRQLAQLYAGYLSARQLHRRGLVKPGSGRSLELLDAIFPPADPWVFPLDRF